MARNSQSLLQVAAIQYDVTGGLDFDGFMRKVSNYAEAAVRGRAELVVFPELFTADLFRRGPSSEDHERAEIARLLTEDAERFLQEIPKLSKRLGCALLAGSVPRRSDDRTLNTAQLAFADGTFVLQDKIYPTACERDAWGWRGGDQIRVIETPWGRTVITICFDVEFPGISSLLAAHRPELILVPSCTSDLDGFHRVRWTAQARAIEHFAYVVHTGTVGPGTGTPNMNTQAGQASVLAPSDAGFSRVLAQGTPNEPEVVHASLDLRRLRASRKVTTVYPARDQTQRQAPVLVSLAENSETYS